MPPENTPHWHANLEGLGAEEKTFLEAHPDWKSPADVVRYARTAGTQPKPWTDGFDGEAMELVTQRKMQSPVDLMHMVKAQAKFIGAPPEELVRIPKSGAKPEEIRPLLTRLGLPEKPDGYDYKDVKLSEGAQETLAQFNPIFHEVGLTNAQARRIVSAYEELGAKAAANAEAESAAAIQAAEAKARAEWGKEFDAKADASVRFAQALGIDDAELKAMVQVMGPERVLYRFAELGAKLGEAGVVEGRGGAGENSETAIHAKLRELRAEPAFLDRRHPEHKALVERVAALTAKLPGMDAILGQGLP
jgi:hypothetical protein